MKTKAIAIAGLLTIAAVAVVIVGPGNSPGADESATAKTVEPMVDGPRARGAESIDPMTVLAPVAAAKASPALEPHRPRVRRPQRVSSKPRRDPPAKPAKPAIHRSTAQKQALRKVHSLLRAHLPSSAISEAVQIVDDHCQESRSLDLLWKEKAEPKDFGDRQPTDDELRKEAERIAQHDAEMVADMDPAMVASYENLMNAMKFAPPDAVIALANEPALPSLLAESCLAPLPPAKFDSPSKP